MKPKIGDFVQFKSDRVRGARENRGPILLVLAEREMPQDRPVVLHASAGLMTYTCADHRGTILVDESDIEEPDMVRLVAATVLLQKVRLPVTVAETPNPDGSGQRLFTAKCLSASPLGISATGANERAALRALQEQLVAMIKPPASIEIVV